MQNYRRSHTVFNCFGGSPYMHLFFIQNLILQQCRSLQLHWLDANIGKWQMDNSELVANNGWCPCVYTCIYIIFHVHIITCTTNSVEQYLHTHSCTLNSCLDSDKHAYILLRRLCWQIEHVNLDQLCIGEQCVPLHINFYYIGYIITVWITSSPRLLIAMAYLQVLPTMIASLTSSFSGSRHNEYKLSINSFLFS